MVVFTGCERDRRDISCHGLDYRTVVKKVAAGVVSIKVSPSKNEIGAVWDGFRRRLEDFSKPGTFHSEWGGTGFVTAIDAQYAYIVTNCHVVVGKHSKVTIPLSETSEVSAGIIGLDAEADIAVLKIKLSEIPNAQKQSLKAIPWGDSDKIDIGQGVIAIGTPYGLHNTVTFGIVSALGREFYSPGGKKDFLIQHCAPINPGNSGSPLIDESGCVIGVNDMLYPGPNSCGLSFAIPANRAKVVVELLIKNSDLKY
jgi:serine protease Do